MKGLLLLANGFEDTEALATLDCLRRSGLTVHTISVTNNKKLLTQSNVYVEADFLIDEINYQEFDFLVCPGGKAVFQVLDKTVKVNEIVRYFISNNKLETKNLALFTVVSKDKIPSIHQRKYVQFRMLKISVHI